jgi:hypothetical protein
LIWLKFWFLKKFEKEIVFESSVLAWIRIRNRIRNWIRIEQKCWIRIRIKSIRIHNPGTGKFRLLKAFQRMIGLFRDHWPNSALVSVVKNCEKLTPKKCESNFTTIFLLLNCLWLSSWTLGFNQICSPRFMLGRPAKWTWQNTAL